MIGKADAIARAALGRFDAAEKDLLEAHPLYLSTRGESHRETRECVRALASLYATRQTAEPGRGRDRKGAAWAERLRPAPLRR